MAILRKILIGAVLAVTVLIALFVAFIYWATSPSLPREQYEAGEVIIESDLTDHAVDGQYTIVTYNVGYASGMTNNSYPNATDQENMANLNQITQAIADLSPDMVVFQEIDYAGKRAYDRDQLDFIADALALKYRARAYNWDIQYLPFPYWPPAAHYGKILSGQALASAFPIRSHDPIILPKPDSTNAIYNSFYLDRLAQVIQVEVGEQILTLINVHLEAWDSSTREKHGEIIAELALQYADGPVILLGDFNSTPPWVIQSKFGDPTQPDVDLSRERTIPIIMEATGFKKAIPKEAYEGDHEKDHYTFPADNPSINIDHIFYNDKIKRLEAYVLKNAGTGSDHLPLMMRFEL